MRANLGGRRIALFEARLAGPLSELVRRGGGEPVCVPSVRELRRDVAGELGALLDVLSAAATPVFVFTTGVGVTALFEETRALGREAALRDALSRGTLVCRGPKPVAALHRERFTAQLLAPSPYTTRDLLSTLDAVPISGRRVVVLHYGERNTELPAVLQARGGELSELLLYEWALPEDQRALEAIVRDLVGGGFAAAAFTSQIQARNLLAVAERIGGRGALVAALRGITVAAVGPTCARALRELGVEPQVVPENPKMGPMLEALARRLDLLEHAS